MWREGIRNGEFDWLKKVKQFKWNSFYTVVIANYTGIQWDVKYRDIINSYTANNLTVTVP